MEALLADGQLAEARELAERGLRAHPDDPELLMLLGRVHLAWPTIGRWKAWQLFQQAARQAPEDPEPRYLQLQVGMRLGGDDGERLARDAIFQLLALRAEYRDVWAIWRQLYRNDGHRRRALRLLDRYTDPASAIRRATLLIELREYATADSILSVLAGSDDANPATWALRAQAAFEGGDPAAGYAFYERAIRAAGSDSIRLLWSQVEAIASPGEIAAYSAATPDAWPAFFRAFWARREPDLTTPFNERVAEHFERLRTARRDFRILHPQTLFHRSPRWRVLQGAVAGAILAETRGFSSGSEVIPGRSLFDDEIQALGLGVDVRDLPEPDTVTRYARHGFDGRGLIYLRFGPPKQRLIAAGRRGGDVEAWRYVVDGRTVSLVFARATAAAAFRGGELLGGDFVLYPTSRREVHNAAVMLERDATSLASELELASWVAFFRPRDSAAAGRGLQDVVVRVGTDSAAVAVWDLQDRELVRAVGRSPLVVQVPDGTYRIGVDARRGQRLGRTRGALDVPALGPGWLALSSVLAGMTDEPAPDRAAMVRAMPADRVLHRHGRPVTVYAEVYDLPARDGFAEYEVNYTFEPVDGGAPVRFSFVRAAPAAERLVERLDVQPGEVRSGTYRVSLAVRDRIFGFRTRAVSLTVTLR